MEPQQTLAEYSSPAGLKALFGIGRSEAYRRLAAGDFRAVKSGTRTYVELASVRDYLARQRPATFRTPSKLAKAA